MTEMIIHTAAMAGSIAGMIIAAWMVRLRSFRLPALLFLLCAVFLLSWNSFLTWVHLRHSPAACGVPCSMVSAVFSALYAACAFFTARQVHISEAAHQRTSYVADIFRSVFDNSNEAFLLLRVTDRALDGRFTEVNNAACNLLGYSNDEFRKLSIDNIIIKAHYSSIEEVKAALVAHTCSTFQMQVRTKSGTVLPVEISFHAYSLKKQHYILMIMRDITERIKNEETIHIALKEKELLLYEIHHRVKNNLQIISSLLDMITMRVHDRNALNYMKDLESKIFTMSMLHTLLYRQDRFDSIDITKCLNEIVGILERIYKTTEVRIYIDCPEINIPITAALPCCLVLNEALSNATRHAFDKNCEDCSIWITAFQDSANMITLSVRDNGRGLPDTLNIETTKSIGIKLMRTIVRDQLHGTFSMTGSEGTAILISFFVS